MNRLYNLICFFIYSNIFIGLGAACMAASNRIPFTAAREIYHELVFIFCSTVFVYSLLKWAGQLNKNGFEDDFTKWYLYNKNTFYLLSVLCVIVALTIATELTGAQKSLVFLSGILTFMYALPLINHKGLRGIGILKPMIVALVWALMSCLLLLKTLDNYHGFILGFINSLVFVLPLCIVFEIKDMRADKFSGLKTLPLKLGWKRTKYIALTLSVVAIVLHVAIASLSPLEEIWFLAAVNAIPFLYILISMLPISDSTPALYYYIVVDGALIFRFVFMETILG